MRQDNPLQIRAIRQHAHTVTGARQDYRPLMELIGNSRFVLLGEASHGTHDFYHTRTQITKWLIEEKGFSAVAVETDWPDAHRVNRYVRGGDEDAEAVEALGSFKRFPTWIWRNTDVVEFVDWLRQHFWRYTPDEYAGSMIRCRVFAGIFCPSILNLNSSEQDLMDPLRFRLGKHSKKRGGC